jgi:hypothetical protein
MAARLTAGWHGHGFAWPCARLRASLSWRNVSESWKLEESRDKESRAWPRKAVAMPPRRLQCNATTTRSKIRWPLHCSPTAIRSWPGLSYIVRIAFWGTTGP